MADFRVATGLLAARQSFARGRRSRGWLARFQSTVEIYCGLEPFVPQDAADRFVVSGLVLKPDRSSGVSELVHGDEETSRFFDPLGDLIAQRLGILAAAGLPGKQPKLV